jgi:alpha-galactosidase
VVKEWASPKLKHGCCNTITIHPDEELDRWAIQQTITILANADYYYTKAEVDHLLQLVSASGVTREQVEEMIAVAIQDKANQSDLEALSAQAQTNTERILNTYTKPEVNALLNSYYTKIQTNNMFGNYSKVENTTLILNSENI